MSCPRCAGGWQEIGPEGGQCDNCGPIPHEEIDNPMRREATPGLTEVLDDARALIQRYVALTDAQADATALWVAHTHAIEAAESTPYLDINSPEKRCGKSRLLETLSLLVARPWLTGRVSAAVLVRKCDSETPTLLLDESDAAFKGDGDYAEALRGVLNSGHRRGGVASLCVKAGGGFELKDFSVFGPKAIAGIGKLPDTVADRAIPIRLKRRAPNEPVERFRWRKAKAEAEPIRESLQEWAISTDLADAEPDLPPDLDDRAQDGWEPLLAIADLAGDSWPERAREAALSLSVGDDREDDSLGVILLRDVRAEFGRTEEDWLATNVLLQHLTSDDDAPWGDLKGKPLDARRLAKMLRVYTIRPSKIRSGETTVRGYKLSDFADGFSRYLPPEQAEHPEQTSDTDTDSVPLVPLVPLKSSVVTGPQA